MSLTWIDKKSRLRTPDGQTYKAGDVVPADVLSPERIKQLMKTKCLTDKPVKSETRNIKMLGGEISVQQETTSDEPRPVQVETSNKRKIKKVKVKEEDNADSAEG